MSHNLTPEEVKQELLAHLREAGYMPHTIHAEIEFQKKMAANPAFGLGYEQARLDALEAYAQESPIVQSYLAAKAQENP